MDTAFAIDFIPRRMYELGYGKNYITRWRHLQVDGNQVLKIDASNEYYFLIEPTQDFTVKSSLGTFDLKDTAINEQQYEHRGKIEIINDSRSPQLILFIQVIPKHH